MLFVVPDRVVVVVDDVVVCDVGDGEDDLVAVAKPLPVPTIFTGFSLVGRARNKQETCQSSLQIYFDYSHTC